MWKHPRLTVFLAALVCYLAAGADQNNKDAIRWRWPDEVPSRVGAGRLIPVRRPEIQLHAAVPELQQHKFNPPVPIPLTRPEPFQKLTLPAPAITSTAKAPEIKAPSKQPEDADIEPSTNNGKNASASAVPLLKDAGKPGNPYILLNDIFPPQNSIRTKEQEEASLNSLQNKDLGGLDPSEVYLADDDLFVVRGFNYKKPYTADPPGPPINDYHAPAPLPPPPPEPGTVFYPSNETENTFHNLFHPDFNSTDPSELPFFPFVPGGLNDTADAQPPEFPEDPNFIPFPFLPPPPPHWTEEKEFTDNDIRDPFQGGPPGNFPQGGGPFPGFALFNGSQVPPPPSGLNGFPQFQGGQFGPPPPPGSQRPPGFLPQQPPGSFPPGGFPPGGPGGFPPGRPGAPPPPKAPGLIPSDGPATGNLTGVIVTDEEEDIPFTPLFPERPVEYYYPHHNTTAQPPGPFGPGIFVPPPAEFFAPRNKSEVLNVTIPHQLFGPPFNLPNYYQKEPQQQPGFRPIVPPQYQGQQQYPAIPFDGFYGTRHEIQKTPVYKPIQPAKNPSYPEQAAPHSPPAATFQAVPIKGTILLDTQYKEIGNKQPQQQPFGYIYQHQFRPLEQTYNPQSPVSKPLVVHHTNYNLPGHLYHHHHQQQQQQKPQLGVSLESDVNVNYRPPRPAINPDAEIIDLTRFNPGWNPYSAAAPYTQHHQSHQKYESQATNPRPSTTTSGVKIPHTNFVTVYRIGGGSYSYNLNRAR